MFCLQINPLPLIISSIQTVDCTISSKAELDCLTTALSLLKYGLQLKQGPTQVGYVYSTWHTKLKLKAKLYFSLRHLFNGKFLSPKLYCIVGFVVYDKYILLAFLLSRHMSEQIQFHKEYKFIILNILSFKQKKDRPTPNLEFTLTCGGGGVTAARLN